VALFVSLASKYAVERLHFSYLVPFFVLSAVAAAAPTTVREGAAVRMLRVLALGLCLGQLGWWLDQDLRDRFYWRRDDNKLHYVGLVEMAYRDRPDQWLRPEDRDSRLLRRLTLEPDHVADFRNMYQQLLLPVHRGWGTWRVPLLPLVPAPLESDWQFVNGPLLPRDDRQVQVHAGSRPVRAAWHLVYHDRPPAEIELGLRAGSYGVQGRVTLGRTSLAFALPPHGQRRYVLRPASLLERRGTAGRIYLVPLQVTLNADDLWVCVLADEAERRRYCFFGGEPVPTPPDAGDLEVLRRLSPAMDRFAYLQGESRLPLAPQDPLAYAAGALEAGVYRVRLEVEADRPGWLRTWCSDARGGTALAMQTVAFGRGRQVLVFRFSKPFAPYQVHLYASLESGSLFLLRWRVEPDARAILADLEQYRRTGVRPGWLGTGM